MSLQFDNEGQRLQFALERLLPSDRTLESARSTGFCRRLRKIHPVSFLQVFLFAPCLHSRATVAAVRRTYQDLTGLEIAYSSFVERLDGSAARSFRAVLDDCLRSQVGGTALKLQEQYACFVTAFIQDSTVVRLNKKLADRFPATRTRPVAAGVQVAYLLNVRANGPRTVSIVPERTADAKALQVDRGSRALSSCWIWDTPGIACSPGFMKIRDSLSPA